MTQNVLITGASTGIGRALALDYGRQGARIWLLARSSDRLQVLAGEIRDAGGEATVLAGDLTDTDVMLKHLEQAEMESGGMDLVIANAGFSGRMRYPGADNVKIARHTLRLNFEAAVLCLEFFAQKMIPRHRGILVGIGSIAGYRGLPGSAPYSSTKAALHTYLESLRFSMKPYGIQVTDIRPGFVATPLVAHNRQFMPFIMSAEAASVRIRKAIARRRKRFTFPWPMALVGHLIHALPDFVTDWLLAIVMKQRSIEGPPKDDDPRL